MKFLVYGLVTGTKFLGEWEAKDEDEAVSLALQSAQNRVSLCHYCSHKFDLDNNQCEEASAEPA